MKWKKIIWFFLGDGGWGKGWKAESKAHIESTHLTHSDKAYSSIKTPSKALNWKIPTMLCTLRGQPSKHTHTHTRHRLSLCAMLAFLPCSVFPQKIVKSLAPPWPCNLRTMSHTEVYQFERSYFSAWIQKIALGIELLSILPTCSVPTNMQKYTR